MQITPEYLSSHNWRFVDYAMHREWQYTFNDYHFSLTNDFEGNSSDWELHVDNSRFMSVGTIEVLSVTQLELIINSYAQNDLA